MKTKITLLILFVCINYPSQAQNYTTAIGLRLGYPFSASYKTFINENNAIEITAGYRGWTYYKWFNIGGYYQHHTPIESADGLSWYYGGGINLYFWSFDNSYFNSKDYSSTTLGLSGVLGLDYKFKDTPINVSLDWIPTFFLSGYGDGFGGGYGGLSVRYVLK